MDVVTGSERVGPTSVEPTKLIGGRSGLPRGRPWPALLGLLVRLRVGVAAAHAEQRPTAAEAALELLVLGLGRRRLGAGALGAGTLVLVVLAGPVGLLPRQADLPL